jgi:periplasmic protein CpxP/Spy
MRSLIPALIALTLVGSPALAQNTNTASPGTGTLTGSSNGAVNGSGNAGSNVNASGTVNIVGLSALEKGANSFTEGQAKSRINSAGFTDVSDLKKDDQGVWRGTATRGGKQEQVGFDYKGNIGAQ